MIIHQKNINFEPLKFQIIKCTIKKVQISFFLINIIYEACSITWNFNSKYYLKNIKIIKTIYCSIIAP